MSPVERGIARRGEPPCLLETQVGLGRPQARPVGLSLQTVRSDRYQVAGYALPSGLAQQPLNEPLALFVSALAELMVPDPSICVGDVDGRPISVVERAPDCVVVVECDGIINGHIRYRLAYVVDVVFNGNSGV